MLIKDKLSFLKLLTLLKMATSDNNKETTLAQNNINNTMCMENCCACKPRIIRMPYNFHSDLSVTNWHRVFGYNFFWNG